MALKKASSSEPPTGLESTLRVISFTVSRSRVPGSIGRRNGPLEIEDESTNYDFATRYAISFAQLPAFRHLSPEEYQDRIAGLIMEIEDEGEKRRAGNSVAGVERVLAQNPLEPPTRVTHRSPKPVFHASSKEARKDLISDFLAFQGRHRIASEALRDGNLEAAGWFPEGSYPAALPFVGPPAPQRPLWPPTRTVRELDSGVTQRGEIPIVEIPSQVDPKARGQPP